MKATFLAIISLLLVGVMAAGCGGDKYDQKVLSVREGSFYMNPTVPVGKAFDQFFVNGKWSSFTSTDNEDIVEFKGECTWFNSPATMTVQFELEGASFSLRWVDINDVQMDAAESIVIFEKILSEYKP